MTTDVNYLKRQLGKLDEQTKGNEMEKKINFTVNVCVDANEIKEEVEEYLANSWTSDVSPEEIHNYAIKCADWKIEKAFKEAIHEKIKELIKADEITTMLIPQFKKQLKEMSLSEMLVGKYHWDVEKEIKQGINPYLEFLKFTDEQRTEIREAIFTKTLTAIEDWDKYDMEGLFGCVLSALLGRKEQNEN